MEVAMADGTANPVPKISVKIWRPILEKLDAKLTAACLRRDAYLCKVLEVELEYLDAEVSIPNTPAAYSFVSDRLDQLDRKLVSLALPTSLTARLNDVCKRKRIVRDAFFNRLFLLLAAPRSFIDSVFFEDRKDWRTEVWSENKNDGPFFQNGFYPLEAIVDPFWAIRNGLELFEDESGAVEEYVEPSTLEHVRVTRNALTGVLRPIPSLYTVVIGESDGDSGGNSNLLGLNCYLPDECIPGSKADIAYRAKLDDLLGFKA